MSPKTEAKARPCVPHSIKLVSLGSRTGAELRRWAPVVDGIFERARRALVGRRGALEPLLSRWSEAQVDPERILLCALRDDSPVGVLDARRHTPWPGALAIQQLAIACSDRHQGTGRRLVQAAARSAPDCDDVLAFVRADNDLGRDFFEAIGFIEHPQAAPLGPLLLWRPREKLMGAAQAPRSTPPAPHSPAGAVPPAHL